MMADAEAEAELEAVDAGEEVTLEEPTVVLVVEKVVAVAAIDSRGSNKECNEVKAGDRSRCPWADE